MKKSVLPLLTSSLAHLCAKPHPYHSANAPSRGKSCSLAMQQLLHRVVAIFLLVLVSAGAWAEDYVIKSGNYYLQVSGDKLGTTSSFNPATCIWSGTSGGAFTCNGHTLSYTQNTPPTTGNDKNFTYTTTITLDGTGSITSNEGEIKFEANTSATRQNKNASWVNSSGTWYINLGENDNITATTTSSNSNATATQISYTNVNASTRDVTTDVSVSISLENKEIQYNQSGEFTATATAKQIRITTPEHQTFVVDGTTYYKSGNNFHLSTFDFETSSAETNVDQTSVNEGVTYSWQLTGDANPYLNPTSGNGNTFTTTSSNNTRTDYTSILVVTATFDGQTDQANTNVTACYPRIDPTAMSSLTISSNTVYVDKTAQLTYTLTPEDCYDYVTFESSDESKATVDEKGVVTGVAPGEITITAKAHKIDGTTTDDLTKSVTVNVRNQIATPEITFAPTADDKGLTATATITCTTEGATIYYTTNGDEPTSESTPYNGPFTVKNLDVVKAIAYPATAVAAYWDASEVASVLYAKHKVATPTITIVNGEVSFSCDETGTVTYYYTTDGSTPTTNSTRYEGPFVPDLDECTIKVIATMANAQNSDVAERPYVVQSCVRGQTVILNDYEDHSWTYYAGVADNYYNTTYGGKLYSPNPRNVKITYYGNGKLADGTTEVTGVQVGVDAMANQFVYYKTIENKDGYKYTTIPNPFSVRPKIGDNYYGFVSWRVKSVTGGTITGHAVGSPINAETEITFVPTSNYTTNCTSMEVELEAVWDVAYVVTCSVGEVNSKLNGSALQGDSYERNFIVITGGTNSNTALTATTSKPVTITMVTPDGATDYRAGTRYINPGTITLSNDWKFEYININNNNTTITSGSHYLIMGRGVSNTNPNGNSANYIKALNGNVTNLTAKMRIESGRYNYFSATRGTEASREDISITGTMLTRGVLGCDYDRASGNNQLLKVNTGMYCGYIQNPTIGQSNRNLETFNYTIKSGDFNANVQNNIADASETFYLSLGGTQTNAGRRVLNIEGGQLLSIAGGIDENNPAGNETLFIRMSGGTLRGSIYGCGAFAATSGHRRFVITGGTVKGWIAGGCNGTDTEQAGGTLPSNTYIYIGGNAIVGNTDGTNPPHINTSDGGNVFGAGSGNAAQAETGKVVNSNVVIADNSYIQNNVYGGGNYGYTNGTARLYVTGGHVAGSVFGGSNQKQGVEVNINMTGGQIDSGLYGGSNVRGTISNNVTMQINGGKVGKDATNTANVHGGGYGKDTRVSGDVDITLGILNQKGATLYGNVYGGSALGQVNTNTNNHTWVTMNSGTIHGSIFGGGMGRLTSTGRNASFATGEGVVNGAIKVVVNGTDPTTYDASDKKIYAVGGVFGGCDMIAYNGTPVVEIHNCESSIDYVYGGGNASNVQHTDVTVWGGDINYVFGGGNGEDTSKPGANIVGTSETDKGNTNVNIYGGTINYIFGGSNTLGNVTGTASVLLDEKAEEGKDPCPILVQEAYGGANKAPMNGKPMLSIGCLSGRLENVYGGSKAVDVNSNITLHITSGQFGRVFGGNNESGNVKGSITVNIDETGCHPIVIDELYAGGNQAGYSAYGYNDNGTPIASGTKAYADPTVNVISCTSIGQVFGGGYGATAIMYGDPRVNINMIKGAFSNDINNKWDNKLGTIGEVFGGGNAAKVEGDTYVNIGTQTTVLRADGTTNATVEGVNISGNVYGGGSAADVTGKTHVQVGPTPPTPPTPTTN